MDVPFLTSIEVLFFVCEEYRYPSALKKLNPTGTDNNNWTASLKHRYKF
jgi:hypothetical protein